MTEIETAFAALAHWFARHGIDSTGVRVTIEMPTSRGEYRAETALRHDIQWLDLRPSGGAGPNEMHGLEFDFTSREKEAAE